MRKAANQWNESAAMRLLENQKAIKREPLGSQIEVPVDYRANPDGGVLASSQDTFALTNTEVLTSAVYSISEISYPVVWTKLEEVQNPTEAQKIPLVKSKLENGINSHDDKVEQLIFTTSTAGGTEFSGLADLVPTSGQGTVGGVAASTETWWRNQVDTYTDASDIEAGFTNVFNACLKGSGSPMGPKFMLSGATPYGLFEAGLQTLQRFVDSKEANAGFEVLMFKNCKYAFSQYGGSSVYFLNPMAYSLVFSRNAFREKQDTMPIQGQNAYYFLIYSAGQAVVSNKSRLGVCYAA
jgi:hypothetical protein